MSTYLTVKKVIDDWDPIGLLGMGCPDDEYDPEIKDIVGRLSTTASVSDLVSGIQEVFLHWFEEELNREECFQPAMRIWNRLK